LALLSGDDAEGYRDVSAGSLGRFGQTLDPDRANDVAWICVLARDAVKDPGRAVALAERAVASEPRNSHYLNTLGATLYRAGRFGEAVRRLSEAVEAQGREGIVWDWLFLAMSHQRLGHADQARPTSAWDTRTRPANG
jgi:Flp pilus assembly protein TadD